MLEMHFFVTSSLKHSCRVQQHECKVILTCCSNMLSGGVAGGSMCFVTVMGTDRQQELTKKKRAGRIGSLACGMDGTRTRDPLRDRQVF